jgi:uncharacterized protein (DUF2147 family)
MAQGQSPIGIWENIDDEDGKPKSHIEIFEENGKLHGKVIKLLEGATLDVCNKCSGSRKGQPIEGMVILWDLEDHGDHYDDGKIVDPKNGKEYGCKITLASPDLLDVRGYLKFSIFGRTQQWHRVK